MSEDHKMTQHQLREELDKVIWRYTEESDLLVSDIVYSLECIKFDLMDKVKNLHSK